jgi:OOP family OmpA-OmpF porin
MRTYFYLFSILLILWISGSSYWYVCRIRGDCRNSPQAAERTLTDAQTIANETLAQEKAALQKAIDEAKTYLTSAGVQSVFFGIASANTDMSSLPADYLSKLKFYLDNRPEAKIIVTGHTDNTGAKAFNIKLGSSRADFVKSFLVTSGIGEDRIQTSSKAFSEPAASNDTREGRARNRRTEINVLI